MRINPDKEVVLKIIKELSKNNHYCPCSIVKSEDTKCPCRAKREENECHCGLYVKEDGNDKISG